jgi:hypothetical protein
LEELLREDTGGHSPDSKPVIPEKLKVTMQDLTSEHLQNAISVLISAGVLLADSTSPGDITATTWEAVKRMGIGEGLVQEWKKKAKGDLQ